MKVNFYLKLRYRLQQKHESLNSTKEQLSDVKEQHQCEVQKREKLEFSLRRVEEETIKLVNQVDHRGGPACVRLPPARSSVSSLLPV